MLREQKDINHVTPDRVKKIIKQLKGKLDTVSPEEFHLIENIHENSYKKSFDITKKRYIQKFDGFIRKNKVTQSATNETDKKKHVTDMSRELIHIETDLLAKSLNFSITSKTLSNIDIIAPIEDAVKDLEEKRLTRFVPK